MKTNDVAVASALQEWEGEFVSRRDRFAMAALTGLLAQPNNNCPYKADVESAILYADSMIAELDKEK